MSWRSDLTEKIACNNVTRSNISGAIEGLPVSKFIPLNRLSKAARTSSVKAGDRPQRMIRRNPILQPDTAEHPLAPIIPTTHRKSLHDHDQRKARLPEGPTCATGTAPTAA